MLEVDGQTYCTLSAPDLTPGISLAAQRCGGGKSHGHHGRIIVDFTRQIARHRYMGSKRNAFRGDAAAEHSGSSAHLLIERCACGTAAAQLCRMYSSTNWLCKAPSSRCRLTMIDARVAAQPGKWLTAKDSHNIKRTLQSPALAKICSNHGDATDCSYHLGELRPFEGWL